MRTVLELVKSAVSGAGFFPPTSIISTSDQNQVQLNNIVLDVGRDLLQARWWPQLKKQYQFVMEQSRASYTLPQDYYADLPATHWDQQNKWQMQGPLSDSTWDYRLYGYITTENRKAYRNFGGDVNPNTNHGQFQMNPTPGPAEAGLFLTYEYLSKNWLIPPFWVPSTAVNGSVTAQYRTVNNNIYKTSSNGTTGTVPPIVAYKMGLDGGVTWLAISTPAWTATTLYSAGDFVKNGANYYVCTSPGTSAGAGGPTGSNTVGITDGTVTWIFIAVTSWMGEISYAYSSYVIVASQVFRAVTPGVQGNNTQYSGKTSPAWLVDNTTTDNTITWTFQPQAYDTIITDSDLCLFDDDIMIAGIKYRFKLVKGLDAEKDMQQFHLLKDTAMSRWNSGERFSLAGTTYGRGPLIPEGNYGL